MDDPGVRDAERAAEAVGTRPSPSGELGDGALSALPAPMVAVLEGSGRSDLDAVFASLLQQLDCVLPERRWEADDGAPGVELFASTATSDSFWDVELAADAGKSAREMLAIVVLIPLVTLVALGALVMTLGA